MLATTRTCLRVISNCITACIRSGGYKGQRVRKFAGAGDLKASRSRQDGGGVYWCNDSVRCSTLCVSVRLRSYVRGKLDAPLMCSGGLWCSEHRN